MWPMTLNWLREVVVSGKLQLRSVDGNVLVPPKSLRLQASKMKKDPERFEIFQCHDSLTNMFLRKKRLPELTPINYKVDAVPQKSGKYQSEYLWDLPTHRSWVRSSTSFLFMAEGVSERSAPIRSVRKGALTFEKTAEGSLKAPLGHATPGARFARIGKGKVVWAVDPVMRVDIITGSDLADHTINVLRYATEFDDDLRARFESDEGEFRGELVALFQGPADWSFELPTNISGDDGGTSEFDVGFVAESVGSGYFALMLSDPDDPGEVEIGPGFFLEATVEENQMTLNVITDFTGMEMPEIALA
jgi:hypothetical protein